MKTFKVFSALLSYPSEELIAAMPELERALDDEGLVPSSLRHDLGVLLQEIAGGDIYDLQERYGLLFDRSKTLALHLFEHVHGESRDRGQAMVDLRAMYDGADLVIAANELPDYLPLFLEFLATRELGVARELLGQTTHIIAALAERLGRRNSSYKAVFDALVAIAAETPRPEVVDELLKAPDVDPLDLQALDAAWEEEEVKFGPGAANQAECGRETLIARLRHAKRAVAAPAHPR